VRRHVRWLSHAKPLATGAFTWYRCRLARLASAPLIWS